MNYCVKNRKSLVKNNEKITDFIQVLCNFILSDRLSVRQVECRFLPDS